MQTDEVAPYARTLHAATVLNRAEHDDSEAQTITFQRMYDTAALASVLHELEVQLSYLHRVALEPMIVRALAHAERLQQEFEKELSLFRKAVAEADLSDEFKVVGRRPPSTKRGRRPPSTKRTCCWHGRRA